MLGCPHNFTGSGSMTVPKAAFPATWSLSIQIAQRTACVCRDSGCGVEVGRQAAGVEGRLVGGKVWPSWTLKVGAGAGARLPRLIRMIAAEARSMSALELAAAVAALVVEAVERDEEELPAAAGSGPICTG